MVRRGRRVQVALQGAEREQGLDGRSGRHRVLPDHGRGSPPGARPHRACCGAHGALRPRRPPGTPPARAPVLRHGLPRCLVTTATTRIHRLPHPHHLHIASQTPNAAPARGACASAPHQPPAATVYMRVQGACSIRRDSFLSWIIAAEFEDMCDPAPPDLSLPSDPPPCPLPRACGPTPVLDSQHGRNSHPARVPAVGCSTR